MKIRQLIFLCSVFFITLSSCLKDTCNTDLGNTFYTIDLDSTGFDSTGLYMLYFSTTTLEELPDSYFMDVETSDSITKLISKEQNFNSSQFSIGLSDSILPADNEQQPIVLVYEFGDRRNYISCSHPGEIDFYYLHMDMVIENIADSMYVIGDFFWSEIFAAGHL